MADGILNWTQKNMLSEQNMNLFFAITFLAAGLIGSFFLIFQIGRSKVKFSIHVSGYFNLTAAIDEIQFKMSSGNIDSGIIKLYGIKDS